MVPISALLLLLSLSTSAWAGLSYLGSDEHAVAHTQQNVVRSFDGTVSHYAKSLATPYSQVHKQDTRISNNVYEPAKTLAYAAPAPAPVYPHQQATVYGQAPIYQPQQKQQVYQQSAAGLHYSPAEAVSHISFDGFGTHWGF